MPASNIHDFGLGNIECHYWCAPSSTTTACQCVVTFGFEHGMQTKLHQRSGSAVRAQAIAN